MEFSEATDYTRIAPPKEVRELGWAAMLALEDALHVRRIEETASRDGDRQLEAELDPAHLIQATWIWANEDENIVTTRFASGLTIATPADLALTSLADIQRYGVDADDAADGIIKLHELLARAVAWPDSGILPVARTQEIAIDPYGDDVDVYRSAGVQYEAALVEDGPVSVVADLQVGNHCLQAGKERGPEYPTFALNKYEVNEWHKRIAAWREEQ
jgi:hypothetical protein